ncbi:hypothetical protein F4824DRAFT_473879 [Ustulina deusta]|nr:hypothetical protein F4823DRAFT_621117 [Ustulina deusta]KAI3333064.1 hypothetical protein F4824DRAFT_473879 [Ustulina deusta]
MASWENLINKRVALLKLSLATGNFTSFHVLAAEDAKAPIPLADLPPDIGEHINNLNVDTVNTGEQDYKDFSDEVESLKGQPPDEEGWKTTINNSATRSKERAIAAIEKVRLDALDYIGQLPASTRQPASDLFATGLNAVAAFFEELYEGLKIIIDAIADFLRGIWTQITNTWNVIQSAASAAIDFIKGLFSFSTLSVKPIVLPASASLSQVQSHVGSYLKQLSSNSTAASRLVVNKQISGWEISTLV